jgi:hypothetical protein
MRLTYSTSIKIYAVISGFRGEASEAAKRKVLERIIPSPSRSLAVVFRFLLDAVVIGL